MDIFDELYEYDWDTDCDTDCDMESYHGEIVDEYDDECFDYVVYADGYVEQYGKN